MQRGALGPRPLLVWVVVGWVAVPVGSSIPMPCNFNARWVEGGGGGGLAGQIREFAFEIAYESVTWHNRRSPYLETLHTRRIVFYSSKSLAARAPALPARVGKCRKTNRRTLHSS